MAFSNISILSGLIAIYSNVSLSYDHDAYHLMHDLACFYRHYNIDVHALIMHVRNMYVLKIISRDVTPTLLTL